MSELRYNRAFKNAIAAILLGVALFTSIVVFYVISQIQYNRLVSDMEPLEATIVDVDWHVSRKGISWQEIYIEYAVDGIVYNRELKTDTAISFRAGSRAHYSVGDRVDIFYDPQNPQIIAAPRTQSVGRFWLIFALLSLGLVLYALWWMIKSRRRFLVTQEEYKKEGEELKKSKLAAKQQKKKQKRQAKLQKKKQKKQAKFERTQKYLKLRKVVKIILLKLWKVVKIILLVFAAVIAAILLFHFFRGFIRGLTK